MEYRLLKSVFQATLVEVLDDGELGNEVVLQPIEFRGKQGLTDGLPAHLADVERLRLELAAEKKSESEEPAEPDPAA